MMSYKSINAVTVKLAEDLARQINKETKKLNRENMKNMKRYANR